MITLLTKRTVTENLLSKFNKQQHSYKTKQPVGMFLIQYVLQYIYIYILRLNIKVNKKAYE